MGKVVCFGEIMMRLNPEGYKRFVQASAFEASYAGGEANVAVSLANYGIPASYVTKVPAHEIGQCAVNELRRFGVDTESIVRGGPRLGIYFCEKGASQRGSKVIYDRAGSSIALAKREGSIRQDFGRRGLVSLRASPPRWAANCPKFAWTLKMARALPSA